MPAIQGRPQYLGVCIARQKEPNFAIFQDDADARTVCVAEVPAKALLRAIKLDPKSVLKALAA